VSGLFPTPHRKAFLKAAGQPGRIYREAGQAWDRESAMKVTERLREAFDAGWVEPIPEAERTKGMWPGRIYYRITDHGQRVLGIGDNTEDRRDG
jgi:hypothetical protein